MDPKDMSTRDRITYFMKNPVPGENPVVSSMNAKYKKQWCDPTIDIFTGAKIKKKRIIINMQINTKE